MPKMISSPAMIPRYIAVLALSTAAGLSCARHSGRVTAQHVAPEPTIDWLPAALRVRGVVTDSSGIPVAHVMVFYIPCTPELRGTCDAGYFGACTASSGKFSFDVREPAQYSLLAIIDGVIQSRVVSLELPRDSLLVVSLQVARPPGKPLTCPPT